MLRKLFVFGLLLASGLTERKIIVDQIKQNLDWCMDQYFIKYLSFTSIYADIGLKEYTYDKDDAVSKNFALYNALILECPMDSGFDEEVWHEKRRFKIFPAVTSFDYATLTDVYVFADSGCRKKNICSNDSLIESVLIDSFLSKMPRVYSGYEFPLISPIKFNEVLRSNLTNTSAQCLDSAGYKTMPFNEVQTCVTFFQKKRNSAELWKVGRLAVNHINQSSALATRSKSDIFTFYMNEEFCFTYQSGYKGLFDKRSCRGILTRNKYTLLCCCYTKLIECHLPNPESRIFNTKNADVEKHPRQYSCLAGTNHINIRAFEEAEEKGETQWLDHVWPGTGDNIEMFNFRYCFASVVYKFYKYSEIEVRFGGLSSKTAECKRKLPLGDGRCLARTAGASSGKNCADSSFKMSDYSVECCCSGNFCNAKFFYDSYEYFKRYLGLSTALSEDVYNRKIRHCSYLTVVMDAFHNYDDTYMCSVYYDPLNRKQLYLYNGFNAKIHFDPTGKWERNEQALVLMSFPHCTEREGSLFPVFVLNCGPPTSEDRSKYKYCDTALAKQLPSKYEEETKRLPKCLNVDNLVLSTAYEVRKLQKTLSTIDSFTFPKVWLFCHMTVDSFFDNTTDRMRHTINAGPLDASQMNRCSKLLNESKDEPRGHRICYTELGSDLGSSHTMCCCFVGVGFQSCNAIEIIIEIVTSNDVPMVPKLDENSMDKAGDVSMCDASYRAETVKRADDYCTRRIGCYHIYNVDRSAIEFQLWAGCTSNIPLESVYASRMAFAAYCRSQDPALEHTSMRRGFIDYDYEASTTTTTTTTTTGPPTGGDPVIKKCFMINFALFIRDIYRMENNQTMEDLLHGKVPHPLSPLSTNTTRLCCCYYGNCPDTLSTRWGYIVPG